MITSFPKVIVERSSKNSNFSFLQIGAHDGKKHDPIHNLITRFKWRGVLVEPIPEYFARLVKCYSGNKNLLFVNSAVAEKDGWGKMYGVAESAPWLIWELARTKDSFSKEVLMKRTWYIPFLEKYVVTKKVKCQKLISIVRESKFKNFDLLAIDTEGFDYEIIKQIDFAKLRPRYVYYEHAHLNEKDKQLAWEKFKAEGYVVECDSKNTFCFLEG